MTAVRNTANRIMAAQVLYKYGHRPYILGEKEIKKKNGNVLFQVDIVRSVEEGEESLAVEVREEYGTDEDV